MDHQTMNTITLIWIALALVVHVTMFFITAPFGRHTSNKWGRTINNKWGWFIMELPSLLIMTFFLLCGSNATDNYTWILFALWLFHYFNRTIIYPFRIKTTPKKMPVFIVGNAIFFNIINAGLNGYYLTAISPAGKYNQEWICSWHFIVGISLFIIGLSINWIADTKLINLRKDSSTGYKIPRGFLFNYISSPNLLGEIIEWSGFAVMAWNLPALSFAIWTFANLVPRAHNHHQWYKKQFSEYPANRKALFPFIF